MLSKEDSRRLALLERQLWREDPDFCARMAGDTAKRRRVPVWLVIMAAAVLWVAGLILAVAGWWTAAAIAAVAATVIVCALAYRCRCRRRAGNT